MISYETRCKEITPVETIKRYQSILSELGMIAIPTCYNPAEGIYSIHLKIAGSDIYTNGKGGTLEFALASAYGEMMERIQNLVPYRFASYFDSLRLNAKFKVDKEELYTKNLYEVREQEKYLHMLLDEKEYCKYIELWQEYYGNEKILNLKFYNVYDKNDYIYIPEIMCDLNYGTNGMASGNTYEEAFVQGMSEIFERYAVKRILDEKLTPPDITQDILKKYKSIEILSGGIREKKPMVEIRIKDIGLGIGIPVFAVIYVDKELGKYFVNFGCHPNVEVAIERCITELFQGQENIEINNSISIYKENKDKMRNFHSVFCTGEGIYPIEFIEGKESYSKINLYNLNFKSNKEMCKFYLDLLDKLEYKVYYQDAGFLGVPALDLVIPGMSEIIVKKEKNTYIEDLKIREKCIKNYKMLYQLKREEIIEWINILQQKRIDGGSSINDFLKVPINEMNNHFSDITLDLFISMLYLRIGENNAAKDYLDIFIEYLKDVNADKYAIQYNEMISSILRCKIKGLNDEMIVKALSVFYPRKDIVDGIYEIMPEHVFDGLPVCDYLKCEKCEYRKNCNLEGNKKIFEKLLHKKEEYIENKSL